MAAKFHFMSFFIYLALAIGTFRSCDGYANFENADNDTIARICETLEVDHSAETNLVTGDDSWVSVHVLQHTFTSGTTKKIKVSLRHSNPIASEGRKLKGFIVQARASPTAGSDFSVFGAGTWLPGENEMVLQCGPGSTAIVQRNGTVERDLPITLVYNAPAEEMEAIKFYASWVENLSMYSTEPTESYPLSAGGPCDGTACYNRAECILDETDSRGHTCNCQIGFTGPDCEELVCAPNTCDSNKLCHFDFDDEDPNEPHLCKCILPGYTGENCDMGPCTSSPCENGGSCYETSSDPFYFCRCPEHYSGDRCEIVGPCASNPCNEGVCTVNSGSGFHCDCSMVPFEGEFCQEDACLSDQQLNGCKNGGVCYLASTNTPRCQCNPGYVGSDCGRHICDLGVCEPLTQQCQVAPSSSEGYYCNCSILFTNEPHCNVSTGIPLSCSAGNPCQNGGTCVDKTATRISPLPFMCTCTVEFKGTLCDEPKTRCEIAGSPCENGGKCNDNSSQPLCTCINGYAGIYCDDDVTAPEISCKNKNITMKGLTEYSFPNISAFEITISDNSRFFYTVWDPQPNTRFQVGTTAVSVRVSDFSENEATCLFTVTLTDTIPPDLSCPADTIFTTKLGEGSAFVTLPNATSEDNFSKVTLTTSMKDGTYPVGTYKILVTSKDEDGNTKNCTFKIQVEEPQVLYAAFSVDEQFVEAYFDDSSPTFMDFTTNVENAMLTEMNSTVYSSSYSGIMVLNLRSGSVVVNSAILLNSNTNTSDPAAVADFTATMDAAISDDGLLGNMSIVPGSFFVSEDICALSSCLNEGTCLGGNTSFILCNCTNTGYQGQLCDQKIDYCATNVCENGGTCTSELKTFTCTCTMDFTGPTCNIQVDHCEGEPCQNGGTCTSGMNGTYTCDCSVDFEGDRCQTPVDHCASVPCLNNGICTSGSQGTFTCNCTVDFTGNTCNETVNHCAGNPCQNNGFCISETNGVFACNCLPAFTGDTCQTQLDLCADMQCLNGGSCTTEPTGYVCSCTEDFTGDTCNVMVNHCLQTPCLNGGTCSLNEGGGFTCNCTVDFTGNTCQTAVDHCADQPCQNDGGCTSLVNGQFLCDCASGFTGTDCSQRILPCDSNPCQNEGVCTSIGDAYSCNCTTEFEGLMCHIPVDHCDPNPCQNDGLCVPADRGYSCFCQRPGIVGDHCQTDLCSPNPCQNGGECQGSESDFSCSCATGFTGPNCNVTNYCDPDPCMNGGQCMLSADSYECNCTGTGFIGTECQIEDLDPCAEVPCLHNGTCTDFAEPGSYNCTCDEVNWTGEHCEIDLTPCMPNPCHNGGTCTEGTEAGSYMCTCDEVQWTGTHCDIDLMPCTLNPCLNGGNCTEGSVAGEFSCTCNETEWTGPLCETDVTPCDPLPCLNGGNCTEEGPGLFSCQCDEVEWTGDTCELDLSPCDPLPCLNGANCTELGPANYSCDCSAKWTGQNCHIDLVPCESSPCQNSGVCHNGTDPGTFICACVGDWIGNLCAQIGATCRDNPCRNGGTCIPSAEGRTCQCTNEYEGETCGTLKDTVDECGSDPCINGGTCYKVGGNYACNCPDAFTGVNCESNNVDNSQLTGGTSSWWIIAICLCFLIIIGIAAAFVCVSMSKKASN